MSQTTDSHLENAINDVLQPHLSLRWQDRERLAAVCAAVLLAGSCRETAVAKWIQKPTQQTSRVVFFRRFLSSPLFSQEAVYQPLLRQALAGYQAACWHIVIDRSPLQAKVSDLLMVSLNFRKRAIPLAWQVVKHGSTTTTTQIELLQRLESIIPASKWVIIHGDTEFSSVRLMQFIRQHPSWDFLLAQTNQGYYQFGDWQWHPLADLPVRRQQPIYLADIFWTKQHIYGPINLFAFYKPRRKNDYAKLYEYRYITTSLPIAPTLRRLGQRRWGIEPMFRDYKSAGWQLDRSALTDPERQVNLLLILSINYLWATATGRWLVKCGRRSEIDAKKSVITVIFVLVGIG